VATEFSSDFDFEGDRPKRAGKPKWDIDVSGIPANLKIVFWNARFQLYDTHMKKNHHINLKHLEANVSDGLAVQATGWAQVFLRVEKDTVNYSIARPHSEWSGAGRLLPIIESIRFEIDRRKNGHIFGRLDARKLWCHKALGLALPGWPKEKVWDELDPEGPVRGHVDFSIEGEEVHSSIILEALGTRCRLRAFPYLITDIYGKFSIVNTVVSWEDIRGKSRDKGHILGRGSVFIGRKSEGATIYSFTRFWDIPINEEVDAAVAAADKGASEAFNMFKPRGTVTGHLTIARDPLKGPPIVSAMIKELAGTMNAEYSGMPIPAKNFRGQFRLMEGGGVRIDNAEFDIDGGGTATCQARMLNNELIYMDIKAKNVPVNDQLLGRLPPSVLAYVEPLAPKGGRCDAHVIIGKSDPKAKAIPDVDLSFHDVEVTPKEFPLPLVLNGSSKIRLSYPPGTKDGDAIDPDITLTIDVTGQSKESGLVSGAKVKGKLLLRGQQQTTRERAEIDLMITMKQLTLSPQLLAHVPPGLSSTVAQWRPKGSLVDVFVHLKDVDSLEVKARGTTLKVAYEKFPYEVEPGFLDIAVDGRSINIREVWGKLPTGGEFRLKGELLLPQQGLADGAPGLRTPIIDLSIIGKQIKIVPELIAALPGELKQTVEQLAPRGYVGANLRVQMAPALTSFKDAPLFTGELALENVSAQVLGLVPAKDRFTEKRVEALTGRVLLTEDEIILKPVKGRIFGCSIQANGRIDRNEKRIKTQAPELAFVVQLLGLKLDNKLIDDMPPAARPIFQEYRPTGPVDVELSLRGFKNKDGSFRLKNTINIEALGISARPEILSGRQASDIRGLISLSEDGLNLIDIYGKYESIPFQLRRSLREEANSPKGSQRYVAHVKAFDFEKEAVAGLPEGLRKLVEKLNIKGALDASFVIQRSAKDEDSAIFLSELLLKNLSLDLGVTLTEVKGSTQLSGVLSKPNRFRGAINFDQARCLEQAFENIKGRLEYDGTELWLRKLVGQIHGGQFTGYSHFNQAKKEYRGRIDLHDLSFAKVVEGLSRFQKVKSKERELRKTPITGRVNGWLSFAGRPNQPGGFGEISLRNSNILPVPLVFRINELLGARGKKISAFRRILIRFHFEGKETLESLVIDRGVFSSKNLDLECFGRIWISGPKRGQCDMLFLPLDPTDKIRTVNWLTRLLKYQITSIRATGSISDPTVSWIPLRGFFDVLEKFGRRSAEFFKERAKSIQSEESSAKEK
jgi:hypothetical protein